MLGKMRRSFSIGSSPDKEKCGTTYAENGEQNSSSSSGSSSPTRLRRPSLRRRSRKDKSEESADDVLDVARHEHSWLADGTWLQVADEPAVEPAAEPAGTADTPDVTDTDVDRTADDAKKNTVRKEKSAQRPHCRSEPMVLVEKVPPPPPLAAPAAAPAMATSAAPTPQPSDLGPRSTKSILRRHSAYGSNDGSSGEDTDMNDNLDRSSTSVAEEPSATIRGTRRPSMLGVTYGGMTTPLAGPSSPSRRHTMLTASYSGTTAGIGAEAGATTTRRHSMMGVSYGGITAPLAPDPSSESGPHLLRAEEVEEASVDQDEDLPPRAERRLSMPRAEIAPKSRETIRSRSVTTTTATHLGSSSTSSIIGQTEARRASLTEIQKFLDDDDDDNENKDDEEDAMQGTSGAKRRLSRRLSMPRAEIAPGSRETIRPRSHLPDAETRRLSLTEVQNYLDGDSSDEEEDATASSSQQQPAPTISRRHSIVSVLSHPSRSSSASSPTASRRSSTGSVSSQQSPSRRNTISSATSTSSQQSRPRSIIRRHSSYGNVGIPPEEPSSTIQRANSEDQVGRRDRSTSIGSASSSVSFSSVSVRSHSQTVGDHPCCHDGPPISLDWEYEDYRPIRVDDWERHRANTGGTLNSADLYITPYFRRNVLQHRYGHSRQETEEATRLAKAARRRRSMTRTMQPLAGIEEAGETLVGLAKKPFHRLTKTGKASRRDSAHF